MEECMQVLDQINDAVIITDKTGIITCINKPAEDLYEISSKEACGKHIISVYASEYQSQIRNELLFVSNNRKSHPFHLRLRKNSGSKVVIEITFKSTGKTGGTADSIVVISRDVTRIEETELALTVCRQRFESVMKHTTEGFYILEPPEPIPTDTPVKKQVELLYSSRITECNDAMAKMYRFNSHEEIIGKTLAELQGSNQNPQNIALIKEWIRQDYNIHAAVSSETDSEGNVVWFSNDVKGILENGVLTGVWGTQVDITDVKKAEEKLKEQTWRLESIIEGMHAGTWQWNVQTGDYIINQTWAEMMGYDIEELSAVITTWKNLIHPQDFLKAQDLLHRHFDGEEPYYICESRMRHKDGHWIWVLDMGKVVSRTYNGLPLMMFGTTTDITERKNAEEQVRRERDLLNEILDSLPGAFYLFDSNGQYLRWNKNFESATGYSGVEMASLHPLDLFRGKDRDLVEQRIKRVFETGSASVEANMITRQGSATPYFFSGRLIELEGKPCLVGMGIDITTRKKYEDELKSWQNLMEYVIKYDPNAIAVLDKNLVYKYVSDRFRRDYRVEDKDLIGKHHYEVFPDISPKWRDIHQRTLKGEILHEDEDIYKRSDGSVDWVRGESRPWFLSHGVIGGIILYTEVITERKVIQERLKASLKEKETLLQEVYHRTKNNMQVISSFLELQAASVENDDVSRIVHDSTVRIRTMALAHEKLYKSESLSSINLAEYIRDLVNLIIVVSNVKKEIRIEYNLENVETLIDIAIPCGLIIGELVSNSVKHAFVDGVQGIVSITMKRCAKNQICLIIQDNGIGLPKDFDIHNTPTLGVQLVFQIVSHQLHGSAEVVGDGGLKWLIQFNDKLYEKRV